MLKITVCGENPNLVQAEMLCCFSGTNLYSAARRPKIAGSKEEPESAPDSGELLHIGAVRSMKAKRVLLGGVGSGPDDIRIMSGKFAQEARRIKLNAFSIAVPDAREDAILQAAEGAKLALYSFDRFKSEQARDVDINLCIEKSKENADEAKRADIISDAVMLARDIANSPPNECTPAEMASIGRRIAKRNGMQCSVLAKAELAKKGFGGITAVGQGSKNEPRLIILEYFGGRQDDKLVLLVGKAVTFDTGGISLKPGEKMDEMKFDKCGGCAVFGIMEAASRLNLAVNLVGIVPSVENMPGSSSYRPGDIIKLYSGKTAEIINTDAEGRLILADAISYGEEKYKPKEIIDFATLTGACIVALGANVAGMISNNDRLASSLAKASAKTSEHAWRLPLNEDYMEMIKSDVADMRNMGIGRAGGAITAAAFLKNAVSNSPWAHFDIAGVAWTQAGTKKKPYNPKGATGFGVRMMLEYLDQ